MAKSSSDIYRPLTLKYAVALGLLAALAAGNFFILRLTIQEGEGLATIVNHAVRQRLLLQSCTIYAERYVFAFNEETRQRARTRLLTEVFELEKTHHELMSPEIADRVGVGAEILAIYDNAPFLLDSEMRNYLLHVRSLMDADQSELTIENPHFGYIRDSETTERIRDGLEAVVKVYETHSNAKTNQLDRLATWTFISTLLLLFLDGWFVFRPMVREVITDIRELNELNETLEERVALRTAEAEHRAEQLAESEAALRASEALYSSLARHLPMAVLRKDRDGRFTFANKRYCDFVGKSLSEIIGRTDADLYSSELTQRYKSDDEQVMVDGQVIQGIEEHIMPDGRTAFIEFLKVPLRDAENELFGTQTVFWDVTDRKEAERKVMQAERLAAIGQMVAGVAHESRNALQQIQACSQLLKWELEGDEEKQELIVDLQHAEERLVRIFEELRSFAAPLKLDRRPCNISDVVAEAWRDTELVRIGRTVNFVELGKELCQPCLADPNKLEQVFRNLFENSLSACDDPVSIEVDYRSDDDKLVCVSVRDNGPGLTPEQQARIFEPFFTTKTQGTGLGMAIVKRIVAAHDGNIIAKSGDTGAIMTVAFPRGKLPRQMPDDEPELRTI